MVAFLPQMPDARLLPDNFLIAHLSQVMATGADEAVRRVNRFVEESKVDFLIQLAILRRGLIGVIMPSPIRERDGDPR
jgi:hypothetical protein